MSETVLQTYPEEDRRTSEEAADLHYFWEHEGNPDLKKISSHDKRIMFDVPLIVYRDKLLPHAVYSDSRNETVKGFADKNWWPKSSAEIRMATARDDDDIFLTQGPQERLRRAAHSGVGEIEKAQKATFEAIHAYMQDAEDDKAALIQVLTISEHGSFADVSKIRGNAGILNIIADYLHGREILDKGSSYNRNYKVFAERQRYWRGFMQAAAQPGFASDEALAGTFMDIWEKAKNRLEYWQDQERAAYKKVGRLLVNDVQQTAETDRPLTPAAQEISEEQEPKEDDSRPWETYEPPVRVGENYELEGINVPVVEVEKEEQATAAPKETGPLPKPLFKPEQNQAGKKPKQKPRRWERVSRSNLSAAGKRIADKDKVREYDKKAAEGKP